MTNDVELRVSDERLAELIKIAQHRLFVGSGEMSNVADFHTAKALEELQSLRSLSQPPSVEGQAKGVGGDERRKTDALEPFLAVSRNVVAHPAQYQGTLMRSGGLSNARDLRAQDFQRLLSAFSPSPEQPAQLDNGGEDEDTRDLTRAQLIARLRVHGLNSALYAEETDAAVTAAYGDKQELRDLKQSIMECKTVADLQSVQIAIHMIAQAAALEPTPALVESAQGEGIDRAKVFVVYDLVNEGGAPYTARECRVSYALHQLLYPSSIAAPQPVTEPIQISEAMVERAATQIGEGIHTMLRRSDHTAAATAWMGIAEMRATEWSGVVNFVARAALAAALNMKGGE